MSLMKTKPITPSPQTQLQENQAMVEPMFPKHYGLTHIPLHSTFSALAVVTFLFDLELIDFRCQFRQDFVCLLVVLELCRDQIRKVAEWFGRVQNLGVISLKRSDFRAMCKTYVLHNALCFFHL